VHKDIRIVATSVVETERMTTMPEALPDTWPMRRVEDYRIWDYQQFAGPVIDSPALADLARELYARPGIRIGELGQRMIRLINMKFDYTKGVTNAASPVTEVLELRKGVCQDFAHLMIALARSMQIPARYVSGLLHPDDTDRERFRGYTQSHAWCELYFPSFGWIGFDPTNSCVAGENYVKVAVGRDYRDIPPNKGVYRGQASESMNVTVQSERLDSIPSDLFPERIMPLGAVLANGDAPPYRPYNGQHQEHAQQQQQEKAGQQQQQQQQQ